MQCGVTVQCGVSSVVVPCSVVLAVWWYHAVWC